MLSQLFPAEGKVNSKAITMGDYDVKNLSIKSATYTAVHKVRRIDPAKLNCSYFL